MKHLIFLAAALFLFGCAANSPESQMHEIQSIWPDAQVIPVSSLPNQDKRYASGYLVIDAVGNMFFIDYSITGERKPEVLIVKGR